MGCYNSVKELTIEIYDDILSNAREGLCLSSVEFTKDREVAVNSSKYLTGLGFFCYTYKLDRNDTYAIVTSFIYDLCQDEDFKREVLSNGKYSLEISKKAEYEFSTLIQQILFGLDVTSPYNTKINTSDKKVMNTISKFLENCSVPYSIDKYGDDYSVTLNSIKSKNYKKY